MKGLIIQLGATLLFTHVLANEFKFINCPGEENVIGTTYCKKTYHHKDLDDHGKPLSVWPKEPNFFGKKEGTKEWEEKVKFLTDQCCAKLEVIISQSGKPASFIDCSDVAGLNKPKAILVDGKEYKYFQCAKHSSGQVCQANVTEINPQDFETSSKKKCRKLFHAQEGKPVECQLIFTDSITQAFSFACTPGSSPSRIMQSE
jgi:hypothetical protein